MTRLTIPWKATVCLLLLATNISVQWYFFDLSTWLDKTTSAVGLPAWLLETINAAVLAVNQLFDYFALRANKRTLAIASIDRLAHLSTVMATARLISALHPLYIHPTSVHVATTVVVTQQMLGARFRTHPIFATWTSLVTTAGIVVGPSLLAPATLASVAIAIAMSLFAV